MAKYNIQGKVQKVGFRMSAKNIASKLDVSGTVKNLSDGSVELCLENNEEKEEQFIQSLKQEMPGIEHISKSPSEKSYSNFVILD